MGKWSGLPLVAIPRGWSRPNHTLYVQSPRDVRRERAGPDPGSTPGRPRWAAVVSRNTRHLSNRGTTRASVTWSFARMRAGPFLLDYQLLLRQKLSADLARYPVGQLDLRAGTASVWARTPRENRVCRSPLTIVISRCPQYLPHEAPVTADLIPEYAESPRTSYPRRRLTRNKKNSKNATRASGTSARTRR